MPSSVPVDLIRRHVRADLPGRFNELDVLRRQWGRFAVTLDGGVVPPFEVLIHPSSGCNLRCVWCIGDHVPVELWDEEGSSPRVVEAAKTAEERLPDHLAVPEKMMKLVRDIVGYRVRGAYRQGGQWVEAEFGVENVTFSGLIGEPLVARRAVVPAIGYLVDHGVRVGLFTNGVLMDTAVARVLLGAAYVHVSLDAASPETYARLKYPGRAAGAARFGDAVANLRRLVAMRRAAGSSLEINASFVMYPQNYHEVYAAARLLRRLGVDTLRLKQDNSGQRLLSDEDRLRASELIGRIREELVDDTFRLVEIHKLADPQEMARSCDTCSITDLMAAVGSDGHLYPCNYHPRPGGASYGSAVETSFRQVWEGRQELRSRLPAICPTVCDPFKNRANRLLSAAKSVAAEYGLDQVEHQVDGLVRSGAYEIREAR